MNHTTTEIVTTLWKPAKDLYQESISYHDYLTELTWLWLLKMAPTYGVMTTHFNWDVLISQTGKQQYNYYKKALAALEQVSDPHLAGIFAHAHTTLEQPKQLTQILATLTILDEVPRNELGEIYEELLAQSAREMHSELLMAPRPLIDLMVILTQPQPDDLILDPLAGVASFLVAADQYVQVISEDWSEKAADPAEVQDSGNDEEIEEKQLLMGIEPNLTWQRLALMNCLLHHLDYFPALPVQWGNSLLLGKEIPLPSADVILSMLIRTQKQVTPEEYLQYIYRHLKPGGRAAVIVPDSVCTATGPVQQIRRTLLDTCVVHTVLRLPIGIFYPHQISAHVLFFKRSETAQEKTTQVWFYDARSQSPLFGQTLQITREHLIAFETAYGEDPLGQAPRQDEGKYGRFRCFKRQTLAQQHDNLAISWLTDNPKSRPPPSKLKRILNTTVQELEELSVLLR